MSSQCFSWSFSDSSAPHSPVQAFFPSKEAANIRHVIWPPPMAARQSKLCDKGRTVKSDQPEGVGLSSVFRAHQRTLLPAQPGCRLRPSGALICALVQQRMRGCSYSQSRLTPDCLHWQAAAQMLGDKAHGESASPLLITHLFRLLFLKKCVEKGRKWGNVERFSMENSRLTARKKVTIWVSICQGGKGPTSEKKKENKKNTCFC